MMYTIWEYYYYEGWHPIESFTDLSDVKAHILNRELDLDALRITTGEINVYELMNE